jgi:Uma2 family endonuclease
MSTAERTRPPKTLPPLVAGQHLDQPTFHERYEAMPPETRAELVGGIVYMPSPMRRDHGTRDLPVAAWLARYEQYTPGVEGALGVTVKLDLKGEPQPDDLLYILPECGGQMGVDADGHLTGAPELVVEISRATRYYDLKQKKADYERARVREYVVVELDPDRVHWFILRDDRFDNLPPGPDGIYRSEVFPGLWLDPKALHARDWELLYRAVKRGVRTRKHADFVARLAEVRARRNHP